jgi:hypothetical protein
VAGSWFAPPRSFTKLIRYALRETLSVFTTRLSNNQMIVLYIYFFWQEKAQLYRRAISPRGLRAKSRSKRSRRVGNSTKASSDPARSLSEVEGPRALRAWKLNTCALREARCPRQEINSNDTQQISLCPQSALSRRESSCDRLQSDKRNCGSSTWVSGRVAPSRSQSRAERSALGPSTPLEDLAWEASLSLSFHPFCRAYSTS